MRPFALLLFVAFSAFAVNAQLTQLVRHELSALTDSRYLDGISNDSLGNLYVYGVTTAPDSVQRVFVTKLDTSGQDIWTSYVYRQRRLSTGEIIKAFVVGDTLRVVLRIDFDRGIQVINLDVNSGLRGRTVSYPVPGRLPAERPVVAVGDDDTLYMVCEFIGVDQSQVRELHVLPPNDASLPAKQFQLSEWYHDVFFSQAQVGPPLMVTNQTVYRIRITPNREIELTRLPVPDLTILRPIRTPYDSRTCRFLALDEDSGVYTEFVIADSIHVNRSYSLSNDFRLSTTSTVYSDGTALHFWEREIAPPRMISGTLTYSSGALRSVTTFLDSTVISLEVGEAARYAGTPTALAWGEFPLKRSGARLVDTSLSPIYGRPTVARATYTSRMGMTGGTYADLERTPTDSADVHLRRQEIMLIDVQSGDTIARYPQADSVYLRQLRFTYPQLVGGSIAAASQMGIFNGRTLDSASVDIHVYTEEGELSSVMNLPGKALRLSQSTSLSDGGIVSPSWSDSIGRHYQAGFIRYDIDGRVIWEYLGDRLLRRFHLYSQADTSYTATYHLDSISHTEIVGTIEVLQLAPEGTHAYVIRDTFNEVSIPYLSVTTISGASFYRDSLEIVVGQASSDSMRVQRYRMDKALTTIRDVDYFSVPLRSSRSLTLIDEARMFVLAGSPDDTLDHVWLRDAYTNSLSALSFGPRYPRTEALSAVSQAYDGAWIFWGKDYTHTGRYHPRDIAYSIQLEPLGPPPVTPPREHDPSTELMVVGNPAHESILIVTAEHTNSESLTLTDAAGRQHAFTVSYLVDAGTLRLWPAYTARPGVYHISDGVRSVAVYWAG